MATWNVEWSQNQRGTVQIEAESKDEARSRFFDIFSGSYGDGRVDVDRSDLDCEVYPA